MECLVKNDNNKETCKHDCIVDDIFLITGQSEQYEQWISMELQIDYKHELNLFHYHIRKNDKIFLSNAKKRLFITG